VKERHLNGCIGNEITFKFAKIYINCT
jgi:hypothetical protein